MPNPQGNPDFKSKYGEKTKVVRLPESIADTIASLLNGGCASSDILESLQPLIQEKPALDLAETDSTHIHLPVEIRLLKAVKNAASQEKTHYLQWILNQCKKGLNLSPNLSPSSPALSEEQLTTLIDQRFDNLSTNLLNSLQTQLAAYESRITQLEATLEAKLEQNSALPINPPETTTVSAEADKAEQAEQKPDFSPIKLPKNFPSKGLPSADLAKLLKKHQKTINAHRRDGNGLLSGWEYKKVRGHAGWRYFPTTPQALQLWKSAIRNGTLTLKPANAGSN